MRGDGRVRQTLVDICDITQRIERERIENAQREVLVLLERALEDGPAYLAFVAEAGSLTDGVAHERFTSAVETKRAIHTLKGSFGLFGLTSLATFCHEIESRMAEANGLPSESDRRELLRR
jgi:chemotaxis protein histidine kinase CheA